MEYFSWTNEKAFENERHQNVQTTKSCKYRRIKKFFLIMARLMFFSQKKQSPVAGCARAKNQFGVVINSDLQPISGRDRSTTLSADQSPHWRVLYVPRKPVLTTLSWTSGCVKRVFFKATPAEHAAPPPLCEGRAIDQSRTLIRCRPKLITTPIRFFAMHIL